MTAQNSSFYGQASTPINVKEDFGAVGDGVTDDTAAIQAALTSAATYTQANVFFPDGTYLINGVTLGTKDNLRLFGYGAKLKGRSGAETETLLTLSGGLDVRIEGLKFERCFTAIYVPTSVLEVAVKNFKIIDCEFNYIAETAVDIRGGCIDISLEHVWCRFFKYGYKHTVDVLLNNAWFNKCNFADPRASGYMIYIPGETADNSTCIAMTNCLFNGDTTASRALYLGSTGNFLDNIKIDNCHFSDWAPAGALELITNCNARQVLITNSALVNLTGSVIAFEAAVETNDIDLTIMNSKVEARGAAIPIFVLPSYGALKSLTSIGNAYHSTVALKPHPKMISSGDRGIGAGDISLTDGWGSAVSRFFPVVMSGNVVGDAHDASKEFINNSASNYTITLPGTGFIFKGARLRVHNKSTGSIAVSPQGGETINGSASALTIAGKRIVEFVVVDNTYGAGDWAVSVDCHEQSYGTSAGSPGNATLNTLQGRSAIAAGASACIVTNSLCTTTSVVWVTDESGDATGIRFKVAVTTGSFTVTSLNAAGIPTNATANLTFAWKVST